jgi:hypothetical protein
MPDREELQMLRMRLELLDVDADGAALVHLYTLPQTLFSDGSKLASWTIALLMLSSPQCGTTSPVCSRLVVSALRCVNLMRTATSPIEQEIHLHVAHGSMESGSLLPSALYGSAVGTTMMQPVIRSLRCSATVAMVASRGRGC